MPAFLTVPPWLAICTRGITVAAAGCPDHLAPHRPPFPQRFVCPDLLPIVPARLAASLVKHRKVQRESHGFLSSSTRELEERIRQPEKKMLEGNLNISSVNRKSQRICQSTARNGCSSYWNCRYAGFQPIQ
jgi:hypothetical protein